MVMQKNFCLTIRAALQNTVWQDFKNEFLFIYFSFFPVFLLFFALPITMDYCTFWLAHIVYTKPHSAYMWIVMLSMSNFLNVTLAFPYQSNSKNNEVHQHTKGRIMCKWLKWIANWKWIGMMWHKNTKLFCNSLYL